MAVLVIVLALLLFLELLEKDIYVRHLVLLLKTVCLMGLDRLMMHIYVLVMMPKVTTKHIQIL